MQTDGGAGVRPHQIGDGFPAVSLARSGKGPQRMDAGVPRVEFETLNRIVPTVRK